MKDPFVRIPCSAALVEQLSQAYDALIAQRRRAKKIKETPELSSLLMQVMRARMAKAPPPLEVPVDASPGA